MHVFLQMEELVFDFYEIKKNVIIFQKEKRNTFTVLIIFISEK